MAGIGFSGTTSSSEYFNITGNSLILTGDVDGYENSTFKTIVKMEVDLTLAANVMIEGSLSGASKELPVTLNIGAYNLTLGYFNPLYVDLTGTGDVDVANPSGDTMFLSNLNANSFSGAATISTGGVLIEPTTFEGASSITVADVAFLQIFSVSSATIAEPIIIGAYTGSSEDVSKLRVSKQLFSANPNEVTVTISDLTLTADTEVRVDAEELKITALTDGGYLLAIQTNSTGVLSLPNGNTVIPEKEVTTIDVSDKTTDAVSIQNNEEVVVNGERGAISLFTGGTLKGTGTVGVLSQFAGTVAPGTSPGCLASGNYTTTGGTFEAELAVLPFVQNTINYRSQVQ